MCLAVAGCSSFNRDWKAAAARPMPASSFEGCWEGTWHSDATDHQNRLRCLIKPLTNGTYSARFHAKYRALFTWTVNYTVPLTARRRADAFVFDGEANLGWYAGGVYQYQGHANATNFFSTYRSKGDHGTFQMTRPPVRP
jgi:hypothetical protein